MSITRYQMERLRTEERRLQGIENTEELDDVAIVSKFSHMTNIEASNKLLELLQKHHPNGPGLPIPRGSG